MHVLIIYNRKTSIRFPQLFCDAVAFAVHKHSEPRRECVAQGLHIIMFVDVGCTALQSASVLLNSFCPSLLRQCFGEPMPHPSHSCLVQHDLLQLPRLPASVVLEESSQTTSPQGRLVAISNLSRASVVEPIPSISKQHVGWCGALKSDIQCRPHFVHHYRSAFFNLAWKLLWQDFYVELPSRQNGHPPDRVARLMLKKAKGVLCVRHAATQRQT